jgi:zona occludens toxin (predicted ATPase)
LPAFTLPLVLRLHLNPANSTRSTACNAAQQLEVEDAGTAAAAVAVVGVVVAAAEEDFHQVEVEAATITAEADPTRYEKNLDASLTRLWLTSPRLALQRPRYDAHQQQSGDPVGFFSESMLQDPWAHLS